MGCIELHWLDIGALQSPNHQRITSIVAHTPIIFRGEVRDRSTLRKKKNESFLVRIVYN